jgi:hypothetical protein
MRFELSCIAALELLQRHNPSYVHFNDDAAPKG